jgi:hypothetical protein
MIPNFFNILKIMEIVKAAGPPPGPAGGGRRMAKGGVIKVKKGFKNEPIWCKIWPYKPYLGAGRLPSAGRSTGSHTEILG